MPAARVVVLLSGSGSTAQALLDAFGPAGAGAGAGSGAGSGAGTPPAVVVAVGSDRPAAAGLRRAEAAGVATFVVEPVAHADRVAWDEALAEAVAEHRPDLVVCAGFMRLLGPAFLDRFADRVVNTHPALLPAFPGMHAVRDALAYGVKVTGLTVHLVDAGVDTGPVLAQVAVDVLDGDDEPRLHERIKGAERSTLVEVVGRLARGGFRLEGRTVHW